MSSQPVLYYFLKERYPALFERIKERVKEGRWEPEGGTGKETPDQDKGLSPNTETGPENASAPP